MRDPWADLRLLLDMTQRRIFAPRLALAAVSAALSLGLGPLGCDKGTADAGKPGEAKPGEAKAGAAKSGEAEPGKPALDNPVIAEAEPVIDAEIKADLDAIVANCEINVSGASVGTCPNDEKKKLTDKFELDQGKRAKDRGAAVDTFAAALGDPKPELQTATAAVLYSGYQSMPDVTSVDPAAATRLIQAWAKLPRYQANQALPAVVFSAMLSGSDEVANTLYAAVEAHPDANKTEAWSKLMTHGRVRALPKLKTLAASDDAATATAALTSFRNTYDVTDEEKAEICPWIAEYLGDERLEVFEAAGYGAIRCGGEWVDKLLDEGEKRLSESHEFNRTHYMVFRDVCFSFMGEKTPGQQAQCDRNFKYLQAAVDDTAVESEFRSYALDAIYYQRRDATTKALAQKYLKNKDEQVAARAKEIVDKLADK